MIILCSVFVYRMMEEIEEVVGDKTTLDADDVDKLVYMNQVNLQFRMRCVFCIVTNLTCVETMGVYPCLLY